MQILTNSKHYFKRDYEDNGAARGLEINNYTTQNWFNRFKGVDLFLEVKSGTKQPLVINYDDLNANAGENSITNNRTV